MNRNTKKTITEIPIHDQQLTDFLFDSNTQPMWLCEETTGRLLKMNRKMEELCGYKAQDLLGEPIEKLYPDALFFKDIPPQKNIICELHTKYGQTKRTEISLHLFSQTTEPVFLGIVQKVREEILPLFDLFQQLERFQQLRLVKVGVWKYTLSTQETEWSDEMFRFFEIEPQTIIPSAGIYQQYIKDKVIDISQIIEELVQSHQSKELEIEYCVENGKIKYGLTMLVPFHEGKKITKVYVFNLDLTEVTREQPTSQQFLTPIGQALVSPDGRWLQVNQAICEMMEYGKEELLKLDFQTITYPDDLDTDLEFMRKMLAGQLKNYKMEKRCLTKSGEIIWTLLHASLVRNTANEPLFFVVQIQNIDARKKIEKLDRPKENRYQTIFNVVKDTLLAIDSDTEQILESNPAACETYGYTSEEFLQLEWADLLENGEHKSTLKEKGNIFKIAHRRKNGQVFWAEIITGSYQEKEREIIVTTIRDITQRVEQEKEMNTLSLIVSKTTHAVVITNAMGMTEWVNDAFLKITEYGIEEIIGRKPGELLQGKDTDRATVARIRQKLRSKKSFIEEVLNYTKRGKEYWILMNITPIFDDNGKVIKFFAIETDITKRKLAEKKENVLLMETQRLNNELQKSEEALLKNLKKLQLSSDRLLSITQALPDLLFVFNEEGIFLEIHTSRPECLPDLPENLLNKPIHAAFPPPLATRFLEIIHQAIHTRELQIIEYTFNIEDNEQYFEGRLSRLDTEIDGKQCVVWVSREITERQEALEKEKKLLEDTQRLNERLQENEKELVNTLEQAVDLNQKLALSEERLKGIAEALPDLLFIFDEDGKCVEVYASRQHSLYTTAQKYLDKYIHQLFGKKEADIFLSTIRNAIQSKEPQVLEHSLQINKDEYWFEGRSSKLLIKIGDKACVVWLARDITSRKKSEKIKRLHNGTLIRLGNNKDVYSGSFENVAVLITKTVAEVLKTQRTGIWLLNKEKNRLDAHTIFNAEENTCTTEGMLERNDYPSFFHAMESQRATVAEYELQNIFAKKLYDNYLKPQNVKAFISATVRVSGEVVGILCGEHIGHKHHWLSEEESFMNSVADIVANALDVSERYRIENILNETSQMAQIGGWEYDIENDTLYWSKEVNRILEVDLQYKPSIEETVNFYDVEYMPIIQEAMHHAIKYGIPYDLELRVTTAKNNSVWVRTIGEAVKKQGKVLKILGITQNITTRKQSEKALKASENRYRSIFEATKDALFLVDYTTGNILSVNPAATRIYGYIWKEFCEMRLEEISNEPRETRKALENNIDYIPIQYHKKKTKEIFPVEITLNYYQEDEKVIALVAIRDITERQKLLEETQKLNQDLQKSEEELRYSLNQTLKLNQELTISEMRFRLIFESTPIAFILVDSEGKIRMLNKQTENSFLYKRSELFNEPVEILIPAGYKKEHVKLREKYTLAPGFRQMAANREVFACRKNGEEFPVSVGLNYVYMDNEMMILCSIADISENKKRAYELQKLTEDLIQRNKELEQFTYITSHNLRAPVANIMGLVDIYDKENKDIEINKIIVEHLGTTAEKLDEVITDLHYILELKNDMSKIREWVSLEKIVKDVCVSVSSQIQEADAEIQTDFQKVAEVYTIKSYLQSILMNLITNAIKYKSSHRQPIIKISTSYEKQKICLMVEDNGLGIDLKLAGDRLFGLYQRFHLHVEGKGLGLHLVKTQVEALGGSIEVDSEQGQGSFFKIFFDPRQAD